METIVAATNYSDLAENAVQYAAGVARLSGYRLVLLNDFSVSVHMGNTLISAETLEKLTQENRLLLESKALLLSAQYGIEVIAETTFSFVDHAIREMLFRYQPKVIVMGMEEKSVEQELFGNTTTFIIKKLRIPVLAVPAHVRFAIPKKVIFACDVLNGISEEVLAQIKNLAVITRAEIEVLLINDTIYELKELNTDKKAFNLIDDGLEGIDYYYKNVRSDSVIKGIANEVITTAADLLIMVPEKHGFWGSVIRRSKTRIMASGLNIPLLSIPI